MRLGYLGDFLGPLRYLGSCAMCGVQFTSTHERVACVENRLVCSGCGMAAQSDDEIIRSADIERLKPTHHGAALGLPRSEIPLPECAE